MKTVKFIFAAALLLFVSQSASAQIRLGGSVGFLHLFGGTGINTFGIEANGEYATSDRLCLEGGLGYYFPSKITDFTYGNAYSNMTSPSQIEVPVEYSVSFFNAHIGGKYYLIGEYEDDFGLYGLGEAGLMIAPSKTTVGAYDQTQYYTTAQDGAKETLSNFTINLGAGAEYNIGFGFLFGELKFNIPAVEYNSMTGAPDLQIPGSLGLNAGVKIPLD